MLFAGKTVGEVYHTTFKLLRVESDRGSVLLSGVLTDAILDEMIAKKLIPLPPHRNAGGFKFAQKIDVAYQLGVISEEMFNLLHGLRNARNTFAHEIVSNLNDEAVTRSIDKVFSAIPNLYAGFMASWMADISRSLERYNVDKDVLSKIELNTRVRFDNYLTIIIATLYKDSLEINRVPKLAE